MCLVLILAYFTICFALYVCVTYFHVPYLLAAFFCVPSGLIAPPLLLSTCFWLYLRLYPQDDQPTEAGIQGLCNHVKGVFRGLARTGIEHILIPLFILLELTAILYPIIQKMLRHRHHSTHASIRRVTP